MRLLVAASAASVYLFGFTATGRWVVADARRRQVPVSLLEAASLALMWPVWWALLGVDAAMRWLFGIEP